MIRLFLVRHGNTFEKGETPRQIGKKTDLPLTEEGCAQIKRLVKHFKSLRISPGMVYCGGLKRQTETSEILAKAFRSGRGLISYLDELDYGAWEGRTEEELKQFPEYEPWVNSGVWPEAFTLATSSIEREFSVQSDESILSQIHRFIAQVRKFDEPTQLAVSSGGRLKFFQKAFNPEWRKYVRDRAVNQLKVSTGAYCELHVYPEHVEIKSWNQKP